MNRISRPAMFMEMAHVVAKRSTCFRLNVGAIITVGNSVVSIGYNGQPSGKEHCTRMCQPGGCNTIHAEQNAISRGQAALQLASIRELGAEMYCTDAPCGACAGMMVDMNIRKLFFGRQYRDMSHTDDLTEHMEIFQVLSSGAVIDWVSKKIIL